MEHSVGRLFLLQTVVLCLMAPERTGACTSFIVPDKTTSDVRPLISRNRDTGRQDNVVTAVRSERCRYMGIAASWDESPVEMWNGHNKGCFCHYLHRCLHISVPGSSISRA